MELLKYVVKELKEKGADDVITSLNESLVKQVRFANSEINLNLSYNFSTISIFAAIKNRTISTSLKELTKEAADLTIKKIINNVKNLPKNEEYRGIAKGKFKYPEVEELNDKKVDDADPIDVVEDAISISKNNGALKCAGVFYITKSKDQILTSNNIESEEGRTHYYFSIRSLNSKEASGHSTSSSNVISKLDYKSAAIESAEISKQSLNPKEAAEGKFDVIFSPLAFAPLLVHTGNSASVYSLPFIHH